MKLILVSPKNRTAYNFRGELVREIVERGYEVIVTGPNCDHVDKIRALGARFVQLPMDKNGVDPFADLRYKKALYKLFCEEKPDVVFGYTSKPVIYGSIAAKKACVPHIAAMVTGAGYAFTAQTKKAKVIRIIQSVLYKKAFRCADIVIFQNKDDRKQFVDLHLVKEEKSVVVNGSGVNTDKFAVAPLPKQPVFFMLARVMYSKGVREYLAACRLVKQKFPDVRCMLLGACENIQDSLSKEALQPFIDDGTIEHFGETEDVAAYYRQCSVFVLPSYREGTPRTVLEAMSMGRAIITTDAPGCRETIISGKTGFLVPVRDAEALAQKMCVLIEHPEQIERMGQAGATYCRQKFDVRKVNAEMRRYLKIRE